jgi:Catalase
MTSDTGYKISNDRCSLRAGKSEPLAFQDIHFLQKIISF